MAKGSKARARKSPKGRKARSPAKSKLRVVGTWAFRVLTRVGLVTLVLASGFLAWTDLKVRSEFDGRRWSVPARIYSRPMTLYEGLRISSQALTLELDSAGYQRVDDPSRTGTYSVDGGRFTINTREFSYWDGDEPARQIRVSLDKGTISRLREGERALPVARIDPALIAKIFPTHQEDRVLVRLDELPRELVGALVSIEDRDFYDHWGLSLRGIARAIFENLKAGAAVQGGSTLTQQLAKNYFLSGKRTLGRKTHEAFIALILEARYEKDEILEAYANEIFLGQEGSRAIHGFGLASYFYFGRPINELNLSESALLVALARGASYYNPRTHPERARDRRNLVLDEMARQGLITKEAAARAAALPLGVLRTVPQSRTRHPAFIDLVRRQLRRDYHEDDLKNEGLRVFTTLSPNVQAAAEAAVTEQLQLLEDRLQMEAGVLQGAVVVTSVDTGEVLAIVGDRNPRREGFNRALDAYRPVGSVMKPVVYLSALSPGAGYTLNTPLDDEPVSIEAKPGEMWTPQNYDKQSHGRVPLFEALAFSYNQATVHLGMSIGVRSVIDSLRSLGVKRDIAPYPSLFLGALSMSPIEVSGMFQTLASGGFEMPLRSIAEVVDAKGKRLSRYGIAVRPVLASETVYLTNQALMDVMSFGTGRSARAVLGDVRVAGKTGTTDDLRDSWFAGFDASHLVVSWVGRDNNRPTGLTGASGALKVWTNLMKQMGVRSIDAPVPEGVSWQWAHPGDDFITDAGCPGAIRLPFLSAALPPHRGCGETDASSLATPGSTGENGFGITTRKE